MDVSPRPDLFGHFPGEHDRQVRARVRLRP